jgi:hypothetical protein
VLLQKKGIVDMKNYTYGHVIKDKGYVELPVAEYTANQLDMKKFIESMSSVIVEAKCGWSGVRYEVMKHKVGDVAEYMVLYCNKGGSRWIPITANSKGSNFSVLGENLW